MTRVDLVGHNPAGWADALPPTRSVDDTHLTRWLQRTAQLDTAPALFPPVERHCESFSQWWTRATHGLKWAAELP